MNPSDFESDEEIEEPKEESLNSPSNKRIDFDDEFDHDFSKRRKFKTLGEEEDRISALPDSLLVHILTFLPAINEVVRTGTLSKRWQFVWTNIHTLTFINTNRPISEFISLVGKTLAQRPISKLKTFEVYFNYKEGFASQVDTWIGYALDCNVERLSLILQEDNGDYSFVVPKKLFTNSNLTKLRLEFCILQPEGLIAWKQLRELHIDSVKLQEDVIQSILLGSPALEVLKLENCHGFNRLDISSLSVRKLILDGYFEPYKKVDDAVLEISAPNIFSLDIVGDLCLRKLLLVNLSLLVDVKLDFHRYVLTDDFCYYIRQVDQNMLKGLLQSLRHVNELTIGGWCIQVISVLELNGWRSPLSKRKCLRTTEFIKRSVFPGLINLLHGSPDLETLLISSLPFGNLVSCGSRTRENYLTWENRTIHCLQLHLKTVKVVYLVEWDPECELIQFLLRSSCVLEKMIIYPGTGTGKESKSGPSLPQLTLKLLGCPRASKDAVVLLPHCL